MNTGHDNPDGRDGDRSARRFAAEYPELARELDEVALDGLAAARRDDLDREITHATMFIAALFGLLLIGRTWWGWGGWSLVLVGALGLLLIAGAIDVATRRAARTRAPRPGGGGSR